MTSWLNVHPTLSEDNEASQRYSTGGFAISDVFDINWEHNFLDASDLVTQAHQAREGRGWTPATQEPLQVKCEGNSDRLTMKITNVSERTLHIFNDETSRMPYPIFYNGTILLLYGVNPPPSLEIHTSGVLFVPTQPIQPGQTLEIRERLIGETMRDHYRTYPSVDSSGYEFLPGETFLYQCLVGWGETPAINSPDFDVLSWQNIAASEVGERDLGYRYFGRGQGRYRIREINH